MNQIVVYDLSSGKCNWSLQTHIILSIEENVRKLNKIYNIHRVYNDHNDFYKNYHLEQLTPDSELYISKYKRMKLACKPAYYHQYFDNLVNKYGQHLIAIKVYALRYANVELLLKYYPPDEYKGDHAIIESLIIDGNLQILKLYYFIVNIYEEGKADSVDYKYFLRDAAMYDHIDIVDFLLKHNSSADVTWILNNAIGFSSIETLHFLIKKGADVKKIEDRHMKWVEVQELVSEYITF